jgi:hypothetical protein
MKGIGGLIKTTFGKNDFIYNTSIHDVMKCNLLLHLMLSCKKVEEIWKDNEGTEICFCGFSF